MRLGRVKSPVFPTTRKISRLIVAVAILDCILIKHAYTARNDGDGMVLHVENTGQQVPP